MIDPFMPLPSWREVDRAAELWELRQRQNTRDERRGSYYAVVKSRAEASPLLIDVGLFLRRYMRTGFTPVPKTGWRAKAKAEAAKKLKGLVAA